MRLLASALGLLLTTAATAQDERYSVMALTDARPSWSVELADEPAEQSRGLMFRRSMTPMTGMLFDFGRTEPVSMWMRNTFIPLDMVFICADGTVSRVAANTVPETDTVVPSGEDVRYVLEINAGEAAKHGIARGVDMGTPDGPFFAGAASGCGR